jgi:hypothetical protein
MQRVKHTAPTHPTSETRVEGIVWCKSVVCCFSGDPLVRKSSKHKLAETNEGSEASVASQDHGKGAYLMTDPFPPRWSANIGCATWWWW